MENIGMFLNACEEYGVKKLDMFQTVDLYDNTNFGGVIQTILALGKGIYLTIAPKGGQLLCRLK